jgi:hypothetical protein
VRRQGKVIIGRPCAGYAARPIPGIGSVPFQGKRYPKPQANARNAWERATPIARLGSALARAGV